jgi:hypothetical protein
MNIEDLKPLKDKIVTFRMTDGEVAKVRVHSISDEYEDLIVDILETTKPEHYRDLSNAFTFAAADIVSATFGN